MLRGNGTIFAHTIPLPAFKLGGLDLVKNEMNWAERS